MKYRATFIPSKIKVQYLFTAFLFCMMLQGNLFAQAPNRISYQAVMTDNADSPILNATVGIKISVLQGSANGTPVFEETHTTTTNGNGLISIQIGNGTPVIGTIDSINWASGPYFIKTETDPTGGSAYTIVGTSQLMSVPYALFSANGTPGPTGAAGAAGSADAWSRIGNTGTVDGTNFIGTTDNIPFTIRVNNQKAGRIDVSTAGNTFYGYQSGNSNLGNNFNTGIGHNALFSNTTGYSNTASGAYALQSNTGGYINTASGIYALYSNSTGFGNTASGYQALSLNTTGSGNTASGVNALRSNTTGNDNTASGAGALSYNTTGNYNSASGTSALNYNTTGNYNSASGFAALYANTTGSVNTAIGKYSLFSNTTGYYNSASGSEALYSNTTGYENSANGYQALNVNTTGFRNTCLGASANVSIGTFTNATALGYGAIVNASNKVRIGNATVTSIQGQVAYTFPSDQRFKFNVQQNVPGLDFITRLNPVTYNFDTKKFTEFISPNNKSTTDYSESTNIRHTGFLAQDVEKICRQLGFDFDGLDIPKDAATQNYGVAYSQFVMPLVQAVKELDAKNKELDAKNIALETILKTNRSEIDRIKAELAEIKALLKTNK
jgi:hypothetical protein